MKKLIKLSAIALFATTGLTLAGNVHTVHHIYAQNESSNLKPWNVRIVDIAPNETAFFASNNITSDNLNFSVTKDKPADYGFGFKANSDFNVAYTITAIDSSQSSDAWQHKTKSCTFVVTANGPANPNISITNYQGANCSYKVIPGEGEDFYLA